MQLQKNENQTEYFSHNEARMVAFILINTTK